MATSMNPVELYHDPSLDGLIGLSRTRSSHNGTSRRQSKLLASESPEPSAQPPPLAPEAPRGPPISYRNSSYGEGTAQKSFAQRARGKPYHREAFADVEDDEDAQGRMKAQQRISDDSDHKNVPSGPPRKPVPTDGLRLDTAGIGGSTSGKPMERASRSAQASARETMFNGDRFAQQHRRVSDTPRRTEEPVSAISRASASRGEGSRRDWASDRSPLQKLEVTLTDISKEEKRARVQEAEMLLRERDANSRRDLPTSPREPTSTTRQPLPRRDRAVGPDGAVSEDVGGSKQNASSTQRQQLKSSVTEHNRQSDMRTPSGASHPSFDYTLSRKLQPGAGGQNRQSSSKYRRDDGAGQSTAEKPSTVPEVARSRGQRIMDESQHLDNHVPQITARAPGPQAPYASVRRDPTEHQRNASHKAALEKLTGVSPPVTVARNDSRRLQKSTSSGDGRKASTGSGPSRIPVSAAVTSSRVAKQEASGHDSRLPESDTIRTQQAPLTPPVGLGLQGSPQPSSPRSPPTKVVDVTRHRQRKSSVSFKEPMSRRPVDEWKEAGTARLTLGDFSTQPDTSVDRGKTWWEQPGSASASRRSRSTRVSEQVATDGPIDDKTAEFKPRLYLRCGPLLRYTGMRRQKSERGADREFWRGSVLIVTQDSYSSYDLPPTLRLFSKPQSPLPPPPHHVTTDELDPEYVDPIAGLTKLSRTGRALYVRPVDHLEEGKDLSQVETDDGLFESSPSPSDIDRSKSTSRGTPDPDGERLGRYQEVQGARLYADPDRDVTFWRFNLEVELGENQQHIGYRINRGASVGFWVPGRGETMNIMFHSCNGFSLSVNPNNFSGPDPMWRDVLNMHQTRPFHVMIGGGDQIYNDRVAIESPLFGEWTRMRNPAHKHHAPFTTEMKEELESFYLNRYAMWFSQGLFGMAASQIPMINIWDDHDIIDGFGSYPHHFMETPIFSGLGNVAFKYYMLFQHQSVPEETTAHEPSWILGREPGPYIRQPSRSVFMHLGKHVAFLGLDCRTERMRDEVLSVDTVDTILERCRRELVEGETKHLIILIGVPVAYPRLVWLENVLTSRFMDPVKALGRVGVLKGGFLNKFDGGVEILDDLDDHWTATHHKRERNDLVLDFQDLAAEKSCRLTILSGDVHLAAVGQFHSNPKLKIPKDKDHRYMPNIISSAIVNTPPSDMLADILNRRNKTHHLDKYTDENMIPMFTHDVDNRRRNNKHMLPRRNWCSIREYAPGSTPPPTPSPSESPDASDAEEEHQQERPEPGRRRFSFSKEDVNPRALFRRLSSRNAPPTSYRDTMYEQGRSASHDGTTHPPKSASNSRQSSGEFQAIPGRRASSFDQAPVRPNMLRRPTNLSERAARKGNVPAVDAEGNEIDVNDQINLDGGLDVVLNVEVNQKDPSGITVPYRLLIPALWYDGSSDREKLDEAADVKRRSSLLNRFVSQRRRSHKPARQGEGNWGQVQSDDESYSDNEDKTRLGSTRRRFSLFGGGRAPKRVEPESDSESEFDHDELPGMGGTDQVNQSWQQVAGGGPSNTESQYRQDNYQKPQQQQQQQQQQTRTNYAPTNSNSQSRQAESTMSQNLTGPPSHDLLYNTERRPPPSHSLEPGSVSGSGGRRSLIIRSATGPRATRSVSQGGGGGGPSGGGYSQPRSTSDNWTSQQYHAAAFSSSAGGGGGGGGGGPGAGASSLSPTTGPASAPQPRKLSKQERILGISASDPQPHDPPPHLARGTGVEQRNTPPSAYDNVSHQQQPYRGYSGVEAYQEPKPRRRTFSFRKARQWLDGHGRREEGHVEYD
ncbi:hypothetical protein ABEF95_016960 [Exophiala dermatitidis]